MIPQELGDLQLLETLGGYTLSTLREEQRCTVNRWRIIIGERAAWEKRQAEEARGR